MKFLKKLFHLPTAVELGRSDHEALPMRDLGHHEPGAYTWEDYYEEVKALHPVKYFLANRVPHWWRVKVTMNIEHFFYWIRANTYNRYHKLDLRQPHSDTEDDYRWGWIDECTQVLYANFNTLVAHYEILVKSDFKWAATPQSIADFRKHIDEEAREEEQEILKEQLHYLEEVQTLYQYWTVDRKVSLKKKDQLLHDWYENRDKVKDEDRTRWNALNEFEAAFDKEEDEMLARLMKIRRSLWI